MRKCLIALAGAVLLLTAGCVLKGPVSGNWLRREPKEFALTPEQRELWDMREIRKTPLDVEILSSKVEGGCRVQELYFTSEPTPDGPSRAFCGVAWPEGAQRASLPVMLILHGGGDHGSAERAQSLAKINHVFAISLDWGGKTKESGDALRTIWRSPRPGEETHTGKSSAAHRVVIACRRALDFAETQPVANMKKVIVYGGSWGSFYSMLVSGIEPRITDTIAITGAGSWRDTFSTCGYGIQLMPQKDREVWLRTYDPLAYAGNVKADLSFVAYTNDTFFWLGDVQDNLKALPGPHRMVTTPNCNHGIGGVEPIPTWPCTRSLMKHHLDGDKFPEVAAGSLREERQGVFSWRTKGPQVERACLYFSPGQMNWRSRYWVEVPARRDGKLWRAELPADLAGLCGQYYVSVWSSGDRVASSPAQPRTGTALRPEPALLWPGQAAWDKASRAAAWRPSIFHKFTTAQDAGATGFRILPGGDDPEFAVLTNSVGLLGSRAREFGGLKIELDGEGLAGTVTVQLWRDGPRLYEPLVYTATMDYSAGQTTLEVPWARFKAPAGAPADPLPFETLSLSGRREGGKPLTVKSVELLGAR